METIGWVGGALWLGLLTAISPCPLASNLAAISFLGREAKPLRVLGGGLLYATGRSLAYVALGALLGFGILSAPGLSRWLQTVLSPLLGPLLVLIGLALLGWLPLPSLGGGRDDQAWQGRRERWGLWSALPMGLLFALAFCPVSAALYFGSLLPLGVASGQPILVPLIYGLGTALPVALFAIVLAWSAGAVGRLFAQATTLERWMRLATAIFLIGLGLVLLWTRVWAPLLGF
ncbi:MAG: aromatic aminobenezylarsenical efflux permease ArsG family transporter [bacterium]|nr:aromatic aminobenezylarsenical efflux permease ArsG family transporter [bacterium]